MADLDAALLAIEEMQEQPYFDADADEEAGRAYYADVPSDQLGRLLRDTHVRTPRYSPSRELYPWVDLQPDRTLRSLYTGQSFEPAELVRADFAVLANRARRAAALAVFAEQDAAAIAEQLEQQLPFNCEHVVPQSWFGKAEPMRGDLHHLFACESRCNSFRGNTPYAEFPDYPDGHRAADPEPEQPEAEADAQIRVVRQDCGKRETDAFEPARGKGAAARAVFYIALRYPGVIDPQTMDPARFTELLDWHRADPAGLWEQHRNAAIQARQGNRNPFIDHPDLAQELLAAMADG